MSDRHASKAVGLGMVLLGTGFWVGCTQTLPVTKEPMTVQSGAQSALKKILDFSALGDGASCAIVAEGSATSGRMYCWGTLGDAGGARLMDSTRLYSKLSLDLERLCGIESTGGLRCLGLNLAGELGLSSEQSQLLELTAVDSGVGYSFSFFGIEMGFSTQGYGGGITQAGELKTWGGGTLGNGLSTNSSVLPTVIDAGTAYSLVSGGLRRACGITDQGVLKCWGHGGSASTLINHGGIGVVDESGLPIANVTVPTVVDAGTRYASVSVSGLAFQSCGVTTSGALKCWGSNFANQDLGDGGSVAVPRPQVIDVGVSYASVAVSRNGGKCAVTREGELKCWGAQFGNNKVPTVLFSERKFKKVSVGDGHACAETSEGILKCWGSNAAGQLGDGTFIERADPVSVIFPDS
jgi:hypothetical protein